MTKDIIERKAHEIHDRFASAYAIGEKVDPKWLRQTLTSLLEEREREVIEKVKEIIQDEIAISHTSDRGKTSGLTSAFNRIQALTPPTKEENV